MNILICRKSMAFILFFVASLVSAMQDTVNSAVDVLKTSVQQVQPVVQSNSFLPPISWGGLAHKFQSCSNAFGNGIGKIARVGKGTGYIAKLLTRPTALKVEAGLAGLGALYSIARAVLNRARIYEKADKYEICKMPARWGWLLWLLSKNTNDLTASNKIKIYNWRLCQYPFGKKRDGFPTASTIKYPQGKALGLMTDDEIKQHRMGIVELLLSDSGIIRIQSHTPLSDVKMRIMETVEIELRQLRGFLDELQGYSCFPSKQCDLVGIEKIIDDCCLTFVKTMQRTVQSGNNVINNTRSSVLSANIDYQAEAAIIRRAFDLNELSFDQEKTVDTLVKNAIKTRWVHWLTLRTNFGLAATMYWEVLKRMKRMEAIQGIIDEYYGRR